MFKQDKYSTEGGSVLVPSPLFHPGQIVITEGVNWLLKDTTLSPQEVCEFIARHLAGDWGDVCGQDKAANEEALQHGSRVLSSYRSLTGERLWVITEAQSESGFRESTTVLLPDEY